MIVLKSDVIFGNIKVGEKIAKGQGATGPAKIFYVQVSHEVSVSAREKG